MPWIQQQGGSASITPIPVVPAPGSTTATIQWPAVAGAISYEVFQGPSATGPWTSKGTTSDTTFDLTGLSAETTYWVGVEATVVSAMGIVSFVTTEAPTRVYKTSAIVDGTYSNGMLMDVGQLPIEGAIPAGGRTYMENLAAGWQGSEGTLNGAGIIYGVRFLLGNLRTTPISGGKILVGRGVNWNGSYTPNNGGADINSVTGNAMAGWARAAIGGDTSLPVRAAPSAGGLGADWTDWVPLTGGHNVADSLDRSLLVRSWHPGQNPATDYAITFANWTESYLRFGSVQGRGSAWLQLRKNSTPSWQWRPAYFYADGDGCQDPATMTMTEFSPQGGPNELGQYGPPSSGHSMFMSIQFAMEPLT